MGLPLWNPPVESDIPAGKPKRESQSLQRTGRSVILRTRMRNVTATAETSSHTRRPILTGGESTHQRLQSLVRQTQALRRQQIGPPTLPLPNGFVDGTAGHPRSAATVVSQLVSLQNDIWTSPRGEEISLLARVPSDRPDETPLRGIRFEPGQARPEFIDAVASFAMQPFVERNPTVLRTIALRLEEDPSWRVATQTFREDFQRGVDSAALRFSNLEDFQPSNRREGPSSGSQVDGLGDRSRSLSPDEGYDVWETLFTTVTPDPQPPSAGSSFNTASAPTSGAASQSQSAAPTTAATSFTNLDTAPVEHEPGCESENDDAGLEDDEFLTDDDLRAIIFRRRDQYREHARLERVLEPALSTVVQETTDRWTRHAALHGTPDDQVVEGIRRELLGLGPGEQHPEHHPDISFGSRHDSRDIQRLLRDLVQSPGIPDSWWAIAGLTRRPDVL